jgi:hypothetical protein
MNYDYEEKNYCTKYHNVSATEDHSSSSSLVSLNCLSISRTFGSWHNIRQPLWPNETARRVNRCKLSTWHWFPFIAPFDAPILRSTQFINRKNLTETKLSKIHPRGRREDAEVFKPGDHGERIEAGRSSEVGPTVRDNEEGGRSGPPRCFPCSPRTSRNHSLRRCSLVLLLSWYGFLESWVWFFNTGLIPVLFQLHIYNIDDVLGMLNLVIFWLNCLSFLYQIFWSLVPWKQTGKG